MKNHIYKIYDNGGESWDRYTILTELRGKYYEALGLSENCDSPQGFSQWSDALEGSHLGKEITFDELPENVEKHLIERLS